MNSFLSKVVNLYIIQGSNYLYPLLMIPLFTSYFGMELYGKVAFVQAISMIVFVFLDFGFNISLVKIISQKRDVINKLRSTLDNVALIKTITSVIYLLVLVQSSILLNIEGYVITLLLTPVLQSMTFNWFFIGTENTTSLAIASAISKISTLIILYYALDNEFGFDVACSILLLPHVAIFLYSNTYLYKSKYLYSNGMKYVSWKLAKVIIMNSSSYFLSRLSVLAYTSINTIIVGLVLSDFHVAIYSISEKIYMAIKGIFQPITDALYSRMSKVKSLGVFLKTTALSILLGVILISIYYSQPYYFLSFFVKNNIDEVKQIVDLFVLCALVSIPSMYLAYPLLGVYLKPNIVNKTTVYGAVFHTSILTSLLLITYISSWNIELESIVLSICITEFFILSLRLRYIIKSMFWKS
ncbi:oligosaccharide flippase family protein [Vibrio splendidus]